jgi:hypothetical protein
MLDEICAPLPQRAERPDRHVWPTSRPVGVVGTSGDQRPRDPRAGLVANVVPTWSLWPSSPSWRVCRSLLLRPAAVRRAIRSSPSSPSGPWPSSRRFSSHSSSFSWSTGWCGHRRTSALCSPCQRGLEIVDPQPGHTEHSGRITDPVRKWWVSVCGSGTGNGCVRPDPSGHPFEPPCCVVAAQLQFPQ